MYAGNNMVDTSKTRIERQPSDFTVTNQDNTLSTPLKLIEHDEEIDELIKCVNLGKEFANSSISSSCRKRKLSMDSNFNPLEIFSDLPLPPETSKYVKRKRMHMKPDTDKTDVVKESSSEEASSTERIFDETEKLAETQQLSTDIEPDPLPDVPVIVILRERSNLPIKKAKSNTEDSAAAPFANPPSLEAVVEDQCGKGATVSSKQDTYENCKESFTAPDCTLDLPSEQALMNTESKLRTCCNVISSEACLSEVETSSKPHGVKQKDGDVHTEQEIREDCMGGFHVTFANITLSSETAAGLCPAGENTDHRSVMECKERSEILPGENTKNSSQENISQVTARKRPCTLPLTDWNTTGRNTVEGSLESEGLNGEAADERPRRRTRSSTKIRKALPKLQVRHTPMGLPKPMREKKEEFSVEEIYLNKNFKTPTEKKWETIFEFPKENKDGSVVHTEKRKKRRLCDFATDPSQRRQKRKSKKGKRKPKKSEDVDRILSEKLFILDNALKLADLSP